MMIFFLRKRRRNEMNHKKMKAINWIAERIRAIESAVKERAQMKVLFCFGMVWYIFPLDTDISLSTQAFLVLFYKQPKNHRNRISSSAKMPKSTHNIAKNGVDTDDARYLTEYHRKNFASFEPISILYAKHLSLSTRLFVLRTQRQ